ncbi:Oligopeptide transport system permease protein OppB (TC 3.A.1.5.1) [invertebrate metagenome]|uniref:Oligopeptide transport system permease protein OppB (TC 3.A.1.5.1) n=1 Tax=invertebrate metagenome TaxID=1711999 RepID=A0A484H5E4_9ZZZZ
MVYYLIKRIMLIPITVFGIIFINFTIIQVAPGGPVEHVLSTLRGSVPDATARITGGHSKETSQTLFAIGSNSRSQYRGAHGLSPEFVRELEQQFGFDKAASERFFMLVRNYLTFNLGKSYYSNKSVISLIIEKLPVSISLGLWSTLIIYLISIPLGIIKSVRDGSRFDIITSYLMITSYAIPNFLFAVLLIIVFSGGRYLNWFPLRGLTSDCWQILTGSERILDYFWHITLPVMVMAISGFASLTLLTKNAFLDELSKQYVVTARAKGLSERSVLYRHVFRNAMLLVIAGFPHTLVRLLFTSSILTEVIFTLDGLGLLGFEAAQRRDYPVMFGTLYVFSLIGLLLNVISDIMLHLVDPRIDFEQRDT